MFGVLFAQVSRLRLADLDPEGCRVSSPWDDAGGALRRHTSCGLQATSPLVLWRSRAWTVHVALRLPAAASSLHFERSFIRLRIASYNDYVELGGEDRLQTAGKLRIEGKEYVVEDGDDNALPL